MVAFDMAQSECGQDLTDVKGAHSTRAECVLATKIEECGALLSIMLRIRLGRYDTGHLLCTLNVAE